jgi:hypothetical protein
MAIHPAVTPATPLGALTRPYKSHPDDPRSTPHLIVPPPSPSRYATARALVRPEPSSPCSSPPFAPPSLSFGSPERPEAELRSAHHHAPAPLCPRHCQSTVDRARPAGPRKHGPGLQVYPLKNKSRPKLPRHFAKKPLYFSEINLWSMIFQLGTKFGKYLQKGP